MSDAFLPSDYKIQSINSGYFKPEEGDNKIRILTKPVMGNVLWINQRPKRLRLGEAFTPDDLEHADTSSYSGKKRTPVQFWAMSIWNYKEKKVQVFEITQVSIQRELANLSNDEDWGSPLDYDVNINRRDENSIVKYSVTPKPKKDLMPDIKQIIKDTPVNVVALFDGGNPFEASLLSVDDKKPMDEKVNADDIPF